MEHPGVSMMCGQGWKLMEVGGHKSMSKYHLSGLEVMLLQEVDFFPAYRGRRRRDRSITKLEMLRKTPKE